MSARTTVVLLTALLVFFGISGRALGQDDGQHPTEKPYDWRWNPVTGRSLANYAPNVEFDHQQMTLEIVIPDMKTRKFTAVMNLTSLAVGTNRTTMVLNARQAMTIGTVAVNGQPAQFMHEHNLLTITLPRPASPHATISTKIAYSAIDPSAGGAGLVWLVGQDDRTDRPPQIFSQGQANWNSFWFPCHDYPNDRLSTKLIVTAPEGFTVVSNGRLDDQQTLPDRSVRWTWTQSRPHPAYLVMMAVGRFDRAEVGGPDSARPGLDMPVFGPSGRSNDLKRLFASTPAMVAYFEKLLDEPYPWDKYAQVIVRGFRWGGMENTSASILAEYAARGDTGEHDDLIAHELMHQWMGDLITCKTWAHVWLNEGWATFGEWMWIEHTQGAKAYSKAVNDARRKLGVSARDTLPLGVPVVSSLYGQPDDTFTKAEDPYIKGGMVLHMLRKRLGDETFWRGVHLYIDSFKDKAAETDDFRHAMETVSGQSLERFFDQWLSRPGMPQVKVGHSFQDGAVSLTVEQTQQIDERNPAWAFRLPVWLKFKDGSEQWVSVDTDSRLATLRVKANSPVDSMRIDPYADVLVEIEGER